MDIMPQFHDGEFHYRTEGEMRRFDLLAYHQRQAVDT
jgi:hypothetical protein